MGQFVREKAFSFIRAPSGLPAPKYDVAADCIGESVDCACGLRGFGAGVNANTAEIVAESRFEERSSRSVQRLAGRSQHLVHDGWNRDTTTLVRRVALEVRLPLLALLA